MNDIRKTGSVGVRLSSQEAELIRAAARADDLPPTTYMRRAALREARRALSRVHRATGRQTTSAPGTPAA